MKLTDEQLLEMYRWMIMERLFDQKINELFRMGKIMSMFHPVLGQEATNIGAFYALQDGDAFFPSHRGKVAYMMRGVDLNYFMAGLFGKREGFGQGRTPVGSHMCGDASIGLIPAEGAVGSHFNAGVGAALALKLQRRPNAVLITSGDAASNRGDIHEGMNFASVLKLPAVFLFVNNGWAISVKSSFALSVEHISQRAAGYGIPGETLDGRDVLKVYEAVSGALQKARDGEGPSLVEVMVDRWTAHSANDPDIYRTDEDRAAARKIDPIAEFEKVLAKRRLLNEAGKDAVRAEVLAELEASIDYAESCSEPGLEQMTYGVYQPAA